MVGGGIFLNSGTQDALIGGAPCSGASTTGPCAAGGLTTGQFANENIVSANNDWGAGMISSTGNTIEGNDIGANVSGTTAQGNGQDGVMIYGDSINNDLLGNLISGNSGRYGVEISCNNTAASATNQNNVIAGNYIGTDWTGKGRIANGYGIAVQDATAQPFGDPFTCSNVANSRPEDNIIGGSSGGSGGTVFGFSVNDGNVVSGNNSDQIYLNGIDNAVAGNYIGVGSDGSTVVATNADDGVDLQNGDQQTTHNVVGVGTEGAATGTVGNVISGNSEGVLAKNDTFDLVGGNYIGVASDGVTGVKNRDEGIWDQDGSVHMTVGGTTAAARNIISHNNDAGVFIDGSLSTIEVNYIGTDKTGLVADGNGSQGVHIRCDGGGNVVGVNPTSGAGAGNLINGNDGSWGVLVDGCQAATPNNVSGNFIGTDLTGEVALPNGGGVSDANSQTTTSTNGDTIGGSATSSGGSLTGNAGNLISSNLSRGIDLESSTLGGQIAQNNVIGLDKAGTKALLEPNGASATCPTNGGFTTCPWSIAQQGIYDNSPNTQILGNVVDRSRYEGLYVDSSGCNATVTGNMIGVNAAGTTATGSDTLPLGNNDAGIRDDPTCAQGTQIGGSAAGARNVISGNGLNDAPVNTTASSHTGRGECNNAQCESGINLWDNCPANAVVQGNMLGTNAAGTAALPNQGDGIALHGCTGTNTIGGTAAGDGNVISGNGTYTKGCAPCGGAGIELYNTFGTASLMVPNQVVEGNLIGTNAAGTAAIPNFAEGILINGSNFNQIGGSAAGAGNVISGNTDDGIQMGDFCCNDGASGNTVQGNLIGTNSAGAGAALGNGAGGVVINGCQPSNNNTFKTNTISANGATGTGDLGTSGVVIDSATSNCAAFTGNTLYGNYIGTTPAGAHLGNTGDGFYVQSSSSGTSTAIVGGTAAGQGNVIRWNGLSGVKVGSSSTDGSQVAIEGNSIENNVQTSAAPADAEIMLTGRNPASCTSPNVAGAPNNDLPCPATSSLSAPPRRPQPAPAALSTSTASTLAPMTLARAAAINSSAPRPRPGRARSARAAAAPTIRT